MASLKYFLKKNLGLLKLREGRRQAAEAGRRGVEKTGKRENTGDGDKTSTTEHDSKQNTAHAGCPVPIVIRSYQLVVSG